ncbi:hypothetical protein SAMN05880566_11628 [Janthinobacterium sp. TND4EL3]|uniref:hypothetical protein n=1 Tax=Janthinobacterium sp. TND4EL3 TaxID=1907311 RepID=UPI000956F7B4|nr:hypothetical protein [Janthinobacterium sp. TND4EL3]SIR63746.1 hypothetical protein SAMN05880566_11628 [Janthinobacterium sp. TND4EL3]
MTPWLRAVGMLALVSLGAGTVHDAQTVPEGFAPQACVSVEQARVLVTREQ